MVASVIEQAVVVHIWERQYVSRSVGVEIVVKKQCVMEMLAHSQYKPMLSSTALVRRRSS